jgi:NAD(P)H-flavin reductase
MRLQPGTGPDVLLVAGGTGLAPFKAMIDGLAGWHPDRSVHLFFGARRADELYRLGALLRLSGQYPWLTVVTAVSDDPAHPGRRGLVSDVVAQYGPWLRHDVYVSGSPPMIRATVTALRARQVPLARMRYDPFED